MKKCSFCGRNAAKGVRVRALVLCPACEWSLTCAAADSDAYHWFVRAVRRKLLAS